MDKQLPKLEQYWATLEDHKELLDHLDKKIKAYYDDARATGILNVWERSFRAYYGGRIGTGGAIFDSSKLSPGGKQGQKTRLKANHFRNLIRHLHQLVTQQKPNVQARASNSDYKSQSQTILGNGLIDYYWREKNVGDYVRDAVELDLIYGESFIHAPWNPSKGEVIAVGPDGRPMYEGDQDYSVHGPLDIIRDCALRSSKHSQFVIVRAVENRWDLAAKYPALAEEIINIPTDDARDDDATVPRFALRGGEDPQSDDLVDIFTLYHKKSEALSQGRMVIFAKDLVLFDGPLPYQDIPVYRMCAEELYDTIYGYTVAFDLLGIQEGIDELHTALMSNNKMFAIQSLWIKDTDKLQPSTAGEGMRVFKSEEPPTPIQLVKSAPESYNYLDKLESTGELLSGISSTVRGTPEANLKSGNALALVVSQSIQFISSVEESMNRLVEEIGTGLIKNLRDFSKTQRVVHIIGESKRPFAKEFNSDDLAQINRVVVDQVNPLSKTVAGRAEIANNLLQQGLIRDPEQYIMVLSTGQLDPVTEGPQSEMLTIRSENEELREGRPVIAVMTENHALHIREHKTVIASPEAKTNPALIQQTLAHIQEHIDLARSMDPALAMILGQQPLPPAPMPIAPGAVNPQNPVEAKAESVDQPNMPSLPPNAPPESQAAYDQVLEAGAPKQ